MDNIEDQLFILLLNTNNTRNTLEVNKEKEKEQKIINDCHAIQLHNLNNIIESQNKIIAEYTLQVNKEQKIINDCHAIQLHNLNNVVDNYTK